MLLPVIVSRNSTLDIEFRHFAFRPDMEIKPFPPCPDIELMRMSPNPTTYPETSLSCWQETARQEQRVFVAPYDDPFTIAGQGTIGTEILRQLTTLQLDTLDAIFVPVGGGGLIAGIAAYVKALQPNVKIIGVEPSGD